ncbi:hypothetical protein CEXT_300321 [Caerostris extrusa]|uniref:Secreted protein n=1 Tax=Caerostris extrusa TaxID=172846 RepID=A0AAV4V6F0_CAEEX|nr:hypothetical protein CEXT_300321 [Caerostris extrusa]
MFAIYGFFFSRTGTPTFACLVVKDSQHAVPSVDVRRMITISSPDYDHYYLLEHYHSPNYDRYYLVKYYHEYCPDYDHQ